MNTNRYTQQGLSIRKAREVFCSERVFTGIVTRELARPSYLIRNLGCRKASRLLGISFNTLQRRFNAGKLGKFNRASLCDLADHILAGSQNWRNWTNEEVDELVRLRRRGHTAKTIAYKLNRSTGAVLNKMETIETNQMDRNGLE